MKKITLIFAAILFVFTTSFANGNVSANQMINIAGKQRMLSQKMAKIYLMKAYGANLSTLNSELNISKMIFERNLETLISNTDHLFSPAVKQTILKEKSTWSSFKTIINKPVNESNVASLLDLSERLLKDSNSVVVSIKKENISFDEFSTNIELLDIIDKSGKQRMLSQRLCLFFVAKKFALKNKAKNFRNEVALNSTYNELDNALIDLLNSNVNTLDIEEIIGNTMITFEKIRAQKDSFLDGTASLNLVYGTTNKLTKEFDRLTSKYSDLKVEAEGISAR